jgi:iron-sulfur cluster assembly accessory protein
MAITLTEKAATKVKTLMTEQGKPQSGLRVKVVGGGCSGLSYQLDIEGNAPSASDKVFESQGVRIYLDPKSAMFVSGTEIDWQESMMGAGFAFRNPMAKGSCGCGSSFTA